MEKTKPVDIFETQWVDISQKPSDSYPVLLQLDNRFNSLPFKIGRWFEDKQLWTDIDGRIIEKTEDIISWRYIENYKKLEEEHNNNNNNNNNKNAIK